MGKGRPVVDNSDIDLAWLALGAMPSKIAPWGRRGFKSKIRPPYPQRVVKKAIKCGGVSESSYKKGGPVSV